MSADASEETEDLFQRDHRFDHLEIRPLDVGPQKGPSNFKSKLTPAENVEFLTDIQVAERYGISRSTVWRWTALNDRFPAALTLSPGTTRWSLSALRAFEDTRAEFNKINVPADTKPARSVSSKNCGEGQ